MEPARNSVLRISDEKTLELIELYERERCLWNAALPSYKNRAMRIAAAERIARKLAIYKFDARHVAIKFKNLRNSYCQELKKIAYSHSVNESQVYKPKVFWFAKMDSFLRPHLQPTWSATATYQEENKEMLDEQVEELVQLTNPEDVLMASTDDEEWRSPRKRCRESRARKDRGHSDVTFNKGSMDDCFDSFGKYVSSMLRVMPAQRAMEVQPKIVNLLTSFNIETDDDHVSQSDDAK